MLNKIFEKVSKLFESKKDLPLCACGCGERVAKKRNKYILGHSLRPRKSSEDAELEGLPGYTKKQQQQHISGEEIDRSPKRFGKFEWPDAPKNPGDKVIEFFRKFLTHTVGVWAGKPFALLPWQIDFLRKFFGTLKPDGYRLFREAFLEIAKKNGKSELVAGIGIYLLIADDEGAPEIAIGAADRDQASIVYKIAATMVRNNEILSSCLKVLDSQRRIIYKSGNGVLKVLSAEHATKHGFNFSAVIIDELHVVDRRFFDVLTSGSGAARKQPVQIYLTTAGYDRETVCWTIHEKARNIIEGNLKIPEFLPIIYSLDEKDDWNDELVWRKANPSLDAILDINEMRIAYGKAKIDPLEEFNFRRLRLNQWTSNVTKWMDAKFYDDVVIDKLSMDLKKREAYIGLDLSTTTALTAIAIIFVPNGEDEKYELKVFHFMPEDNVERTEKNCKSHSPYTQWIRDGFIETTPGGSVDYEFVKSKIAALSKVCNIKEINADPWNATQLLGQLQNDGFTVTEIRQGMQALSAPTKKFYEMLINKQIRIERNPCLRWQLDHCSVIKDVNENIRPVKDKSTSRIDGIMASIFAIDRATRQPEKKKSVYEDRGIRTL